MAEPVSIVEEEEDKEDQSSEEEEYDENGDSDSLSLTHIVSIKNHGLWIGPKRRPFRFRVSLQTLCEFEQVFTDEQAKVRALNLRTAQGRRYVMLKIHTVQFPISCYKDVVIRLKLSTTFESVYDVIREVEDFLSMPIDRRFRKILDDHPTTFEQYADAHYRGFYLHGETFLMNAEIQDDGRTFMTNTGGTHPHRGGILVLSCGS